MATVPFLDTVLSGWKITAAGWNAAVRDGVNWFIKDRPMCVLTASASQSIPASTFTAIGMDTEVIDRDGQHEQLANVDRITIGNTPGWYEVSGVVAWNGNVAGSRRAAINLNGVQVTGGYCVVAPTNTFCTVSVSARVYAASASDYVNLTGWQDTAGALGTASSGALKSSLSAVWLSS